MRNLGHLDVVEYHLAVPSRRCLIHFVVGTTPHEACTLFAWLLLKRERRQWWWRFELLWKCSVAGFGILDAFILDTTFWSLDFGFWTSDFGFESLDSGFLI